VFAATVATLLSACLTARGTKAPSRAPLQLRVTRQVQGEDEHGQQCGKVFVAANRALTQERLDSLVVAQQCPQLLFTDAALKAQFEAWRACSLPVEMYVDVQAASRSAGVSAREAQREAWAHEQVCAPEQDDHYVESYGNLEVHQLMLQDRERCAWYEAELERACSVVRDAVVLDVGCGCGLLALFAARAGARKVYAVESNSKMAALAQAVVADNGMQSRVSVVHGRVEDVDLPEGVDILVSEWMGFYLLHESMLDSVLVARDRFLKKTGIMIPQSCRLLAAPVCNPTRRTQRVEFWMRANHTYGFNFSSAAPLASQEMSATPVIEVVPKEALLSPGQVVWQAQLQRLSVRELDEISKHDLEFTLGGSSRHGSHMASAVDGICLWFSVQAPSMNALVECAVGNRGGAPAGAGVGGRGKVRAGTQSPNDSNDGGSVFSSGPYDAQTHWKQTIISLPAPLPLRRTGDGGQGAREGEGLRIRCALALRRAVPEGGAFCRQYLLSLTVSQEASALALLQSMQDA
jgi:type I protein arginine methyltransferase